MRIAIVGTGISGLVAAHQLHPEHEITVYEAADAARRPHATRSRSRPRTATHWIDTGFIVFNDRNYPNFEALLAELGVASQPSHMGFSVSDGAARFEYSGTPRGLFARPAHLLSPTFLGMLRDWRRFNREARALIGMNGTAPSLGALARAAGLLPALHRAPDRAPGLRRLVGRPGADVELPGQLHGRVLRQPRHVQPARPAALADRQRRLAQLRRGDLGALARPGAAARRRCGGSSGSPDGVRIEAEGCESEEFDEVVIATHSDQALAHARRPERGRARDPRRDPLPAQRGRPPHRRLAAAAPPRRLVELELPPRRRRRRAAAPSPTG